MTTENIDNDVFMKDRDIQEGINLGNINVTSTDEGIVVPSEATILENERQRELLKTLKDRQLKLNLKIPTDDNEVKLRLRALKQPICYFGEDASDRRDRLRDELSAIVSSGKPLPEFNFGDRSLTTSDNISRSIDIKEYLRRINDNRPFFSQGSSDLKECRLNILYYSLQKSKIRVNKQRKERENPLPISSLRSNLHNLTNDLKLFEQENSMYIEERPLASIRISNKIYHTQKIKKEKKEEKEEINNNFKIPKIKNNKKRNVSFLNNKKNNNKKRRRIILPVKNFISNDLSSNGSNIIAVGNVGGDIYLYDTSGNCKCNIIGYHNDRITGLAWNNIYNKSINNSYLNNNFLLSCSSDYNCILWKYNESQIELIHKFNNIHSNNRMGRCNFHPISSYFGTTGYNNKWNLFDINKCKLLLSQGGHSSEVYSIAFHYDGSLVATGDLGGVIRIWDCRSGRAISGLTNHCRGVLDLDFNCNGYILGSCGQDNTIKLWDLRKQSEYTLASHFNIVTGVRFNKQFGNWFISCGFDKLLKLWTTQKYLNVKSFKQESRISDLDLSYSGDIIVVSCHDRTFKIFKKCSENNENSYNIIKKEIKVKVESSNNKKNIIKKERSITPTVEMSASNSGINSSSSNTSSGNSNNNLNGKMNGININNIFNNTINNNNINNINNNNGIINNSKLSKMEIDE